MGRDLESPPLQKTLQVGVQVFWEMRLKGYNNMLAWAETRRSQIMGLLHMLLDDSRLVYDDLKVLTPQLDAMLAWVIVNKPKMELASATFWTLLLAVHALAIRRGQWEVHQREAEMASEPWSMYQLLKSGVTQGRTKASSSSSSQTSCLRTYSLGNNNRLRRRTEVFFHIHSTSGAHPRLYEEMREIWWTLPSVNPIRPGTAAINHSVTIIRRTKRRISPSVGTDAITDDLTPCASCSSCSSCTPCSSCAPCAPCTFKPTTLTVWGYDFDVTSPTVPSSQSCAPWTHPRPNS
jgi:hypothetical protein